MFLGEKNVGWVKITFTSAFVFMIWKLLALSPQRRPPVLRQILNVYTSKLRPQVQRVNLLGQLKCDQHLTYRTFVQRWNTRSDNYMSPAGIGNLHFINGIIVSILFFWHFNRQFNRNCPKIMSVMNRTTIQSIQRRRYKNGWSTSTYTSSISKH